MGDLNKNQEVDTDGELILRKDPGNVEAMAKATHRMEGKVAVCVASSIGIGYAIARRLAQEGATVVISARKQGPIDKSVEALKSEGLQASGFACDVTKDEDRAALKEFVAKTHGKCDCLILNQGTNEGGGKLMKTTRDKFSKVMLTNVESRWQMVVDFKEMMPRGSSIVITNGSGAYFPMPAAGAFYVSETALLGLTL